jgi:hypothetical protein
MSGWDANRPHEAFEGWRQPAPDPAQTADTREVSGCLMWLLRRAGDEWGPMGVALAAASLTDKDALIARLSEPQQNHGDRDA